MPISKRGRKKKSGWEPMSNLEEPPYKKSKGSPRSSLPAVSLLPPRVIALHRKYTNFTPCYKKSREEVSPLWSLPNDLALSCLVRVSRSDHTALSMVSKSYRSVVASSELYEIRSVMNRTETDVYVCLRTPPIPHPRWYILRSRNLISIPSFPSQSPEGSSVVAMGFGIYVMGGLVKGNHISDVLFLDCRTHTWRRVPSMRVARASAAAAVVEGKIYVIGGCDYFTDKEHIHKSLNWGEVFDPHTQTWDPLPPMPFPMSDYIHDCVVRDRKVYAVQGGRRSIYYSPSEGKWGIGNPSQLTGAPRDWCMIDNLLYSINKHGRVFWCEQEHLEPEGMFSWQELKGLETLKGNLSCSRLVRFGPKFVDKYDKEIQELAVIYPGARLTNSGRNILLFWDEMVGNIQQIWCAEISLERPQRGNSNIEWSQVVMTVDGDPFIDRYKVLYSVSVTL